MPKIICKKCDAIVPAPGLYCSAGADLVCQGRWPIGPCGAILTAEERHWYGSSCEKCEAAWSERIQTWRDGAQDNALDEMFGVPNRVTH